MKEITKNSLHKGFKVCQKCHFVSEKFEKQKGHRNGSFHAGTPLGFTLGSFFSFYFGFFFGFALVFTPAEHSRKCGWFHFTGFRPFLKPPDTNLVTRKTMNPPTRFSFMVGNICACPWRPQKESKYHRKCERQASFFLVVKILTNLARHNPKWRQRLLGVCF